MRVAYLCWDYSENWITECVEESEEDAKNWHSYIKIILPKETDTMGKCVGIVPAPKK
jgi:hypothetical protein